MARSNVQIAVGSYTGNAVDNTNISGVGFRPKMVIVKGGSNAAVFRNHPSGGDSTSQFPASANIANAVQELLADGFQVGTDVRANANGTVYSYIAFNWNSAQSSIRSVRYTGDGTTPRTLNTFGLNFTPDLAAIFVDAALGKVFKTNAMATNSCARFDANVNTTAAIVDLISNGFTVGNATTANQATSVYTGFALASTPGVMKVGSYVGTGSSLPIIGMGFTPSAVFIKRSGASACALRTSIQTGDTTLFVTALASSTACITSLDTDGFTVGTDVSVNNSGDTYYWFAFNSGNFNVPITRNSA